MAVPQRFLALIKIVSDLMDDPQAEAFNAPVDWKALGLKDYPKIVTNPMDLGTVRNKLELGRYSSLEAAADDVRQIWTNCLIFNDEGSELSMVAEMFADRFEEQFDKLLQSTAVRQRVKRPPKDPDAPLNVDARSSMAYEISGCDPDTQRRLVAMLVKLNPVVVSVVPEDPTDIAINLDALLPSESKQVIRFLKRYGPKKDRRYGNTKRAKRTTK